ncbi:hypothetical protein GCM10010451_43450 [Streptomyces virens]|uniref:Transposase n=1 Tax=Streptomyces virens TaxID=285572 RepID=A0ABP6PSS4_9ACTN|nr:hypothetical protein GCM10010247_30640 [Streptomyces calvus]
MVRHLGPHSRGDRRPRRPGSSPPRPRELTARPPPSYSSRRNRRYLRRRRIEHTIPEPKDQRANRKRRGSKGGLPTGFDSDICKRRNEVERAINRLKNSRAAATRHDRRAFVFHATVMAAAIRLWLRP